MDGGTFFVLAIIRPCSFLCAAETHFKILVLQPANPSSKSWLAIPKFFKHIPVFNDLLQVIVFLLASSQEYMHPYDSFLNV